MLCSVSSTSLQTLGIALACCVAATSPCCLLASRTTRAIRLLACTAPCVATSTPQSQVEPHVRVYIPPPVTALHCCTPVTEHACCVSTTVPFPDLDGAYFGRTFPHLFLMVFPKLVPSRLQTREYIGKIYGFRVYERPLLQDGGRGGGSSGSSGGAAGAGAGAVASASSSRKKRNDGTKASSSTTARTSKAAAAAAAAAAPTAAAASSAHTTTASAAARDTTMRVAHAP